MKIKKFEDLLVWEKSVDLTIHIHSSLEFINDFGLKNQIQRASLSISNNIAEGFERGSDRDFKRFYTSLRARRVKLSPCFMLLFD